MLAMDAIGGDPRQRQAGNRHRGDPGGDRAAQSRRRRAIPTAPLRALIFDSHFDQYLGVVAYVRVVDGEIRPGMRIRMMSSGKEFEVSGGRASSSRRWQTTDRLGTGEVGYFTAGMKNVGDTRVGDTITDAAKPATEPLPGYREVKPMVFCGLYPDGLAAVYDAARRARRSCSSTTPRSRTSRRAPRRWGSASGAGSSGCCTWRSCRSGWSASSA